MPIAGPIAPGIAKWSAFQAWFVMNLCWGYNRESRMKRSNFTHAIHAGLWRIMHARGFGTISKTERRLGWPGSGLRKRRDRKDGLRLGELGAVLEVLDEPPGGFFAEVFGGPASAMDRFLVGSVRFASTIDLPTPADTKTSSRLSEDDLEALDQLRFTNAEAAAQAAHVAAFSAAEEGRREDTAAAMARLASAYRVLCRLEEAQACLGWTLQHVTEGPIAADAWLRAGSVMSEYAAFTDAAELAGVAILMFFESGDPTRAARALVSRSIFLQRTGDTDKAIRGYQSALLSLPESEARNRYATHLNLGLAYATTRQLGKASHHARRAEKIGASGYLALRLDWLLARIAAAEHSHLQAIARYRRLLVRLRSRPPDAALAAAELCRVFIDAGRPADAIAQAGDMVRWVLPLGQHRLVAAAIADLYRSAQQGRLTLALIDQIIRKIRQGRDRRAEQPCPHRRL